MKVLFCDWLQIPGRDTGIPVKKLHLSTFSDDDDVDDSAVRAMDTRLGGLGFDLGTNFSKTYPGLCVFGSAPQ